MADSIVDLVQFALSQHDRSGTGRILERVCQRFGAYCAILWREVKESEPRVLYTMAEWFPGTARWSRHNLPFESLTGATIRTGKTTVTEARDQRINNDTGFFDKHGIHTVCCLATGSSGTLNLYWQSPRELTPPEIQDAEEIARLMPSLHEAVQRSFRFEMLDAVKGVLQSVELPVAGGDDRLDRADTVLNAVASAVGKFMQCEETSIFLSDRWDQAESFVLRGSAPVAIGTRREYRAGDPGPTGHVLQQKKPLWVFDWKHFLRDKHTFRDLRDLSGPEEDPRGGSQSKDGSGPPESFMAAPIMAGGTVLGVIRCSKAISSPYYFSDLEVEALELVAVQLSQFWQQFLSRVQLTKEIRVWRQYADVVADLNRFVARELRRPEIREQAIMQRSIDEIEKVLPLTDVLSIRLADEGQTELYFAAVGGKEWTGLGPVQSALILQKKFSLASGQKSTGAHVFHMQNTYHVANAKSDPFHEVTFPNQRSEIAAPISLRDDKYGVLTIGTTGNQAFMPYEQTLATQLGQQLGLYIHLARSIARLRTTERDLEQTNKAQTQSFENLQHQIKSPLRQALERCREALAIQDNDPNPAREMHLLAIRGMVTKARNVAMQLETFVSLAKETKLAFRPVRWDVTAATRLLRETCEDNKRLYERRALRYALDAKSLEVLSNYNVQIDESLLPQAVNNIIDNAYKYSFRETTIAISAGIEESQFYLSITNKGLPITKDEIPRLRLRGERGEKAKLTVGDGSGLGWWLVDHIMAAHRGTMVIKPTTGSGMTEVRLVFPTDVSKNTGGR